MKKTAVPKIILYALLNTLLIFCILLVFRWVFYSQFAHSFGDVQQNSDLIRKAFLLGIRFDIKLAVMAALPANLLMLIFTRDFFTRQAWRIASCTYLLAATLTIILMMAADMGNYSYLGERLNASILSFLENPLISAGMLWESYPIGWAALGFIVLGVILWFVLSLIYHLSARGATLQKIWQKILCGSLVVLLTAWGIYGSVSHYPLRWGETFFCENKAVNQFALNPVLFFFDSFKFRNDDFNKEELERYYPAMASYMNLNKDSIDFQRPALFFEGPDTMPKRNIVFVMLESMGYAATGLSGNRIAPTPRFDSLCLESVYAPRMYCPNPGTAYSMFASLVGLPDVMDVKTASRNPRAVDQRILFDQGEGYAKYYMIGGSASWANIRSLFTGNINELTVMEEGSYRNERRVDVWGIDDYDLFTYADEVLDSLNGEQKPFMVFIQSATNHRPYTVPEEKDGWRPLREDEIDPNELHRNGFLELGQFNALRYFDFNIGRFMDLAKGSDYYKNTVFVFFGDHNMSMNPYDHTPSPDFAADLGSYHIPGVIHAAFLEPKVYSEPANTIDLFVSAMDAARIPHINYTLGTSIFDSLGTSGPRVSFAYTKIGARRAASVITDSLYYQTTVTEPYESRLYRYGNGQPFEEITDTQAQARLDSLAKGFYHSTKYLYYNNQKR